MKIPVMQDLLFPPREPFSGTLVVEIPDLNAEEGRTLVADLITRYPDKGLKFEVRSAKKEEGGGEAANPTGVTPDLQRV